jgi:hypothetical protein
MIDRNEIARELEAVRLRTIELLRDAEARRALEQRARKLGINPENATTNDFWRIDQDQQIDMLILDLPNEGTDIFVRERAILAAKGLF